MKLRSISISNILSFKYEADLARCQTIEFDEGLNILVGPNGSGKSNLLEVINYLFHRVLFKRFRYEEERLEQSVSDADRLTYIKHTIRLDQVSNSYWLAANNATPYSASTIRIKLSFNEDDRNNLLFVHKNASSINAFIGKYSGMPLEFKGGFDVHPIRELRELELTFIRNNDSEFRLISTVGTGPRQFIVQYLEYFELLQAIILVANKSEDVQWTPLKDSLALIGCYRNYESYNGSIKAEGNEQSSLQQTIQKVRVQSARSAFSGEPAVFELVKKKIAYQYARLKDDKGKAWADKQIGEFDLFKQIGQLIRLDPLQLRMQVDRQSATSLDYEVQFRHISTGQLVFVDTLSGGQKSLLYLVFSLLGFDNANGLILIDEPELHLHLQSQQVYLTILEEISKTMQIQFIVATHSSAFIYPSHIFYIYRFYLQNGFTWIVHPEITESDRQILQIITLSNAAKIFFGERILLVEGETDEYFYRFLVSELVKEGKIPHGIEIIHIQGKGNYRLWKGFLDKFAMPCYFLGDWDNVVEFSLISSKELADYAGKAGWTEAVDKGILKKDSRDRIALADLIAEVCRNPSAENLERLRQLREYLIGRYVGSKKVLEWLRRQEPAIFETIGEGIANLRKQHVYLLPDGELEDYLGIQKGMEAMVQFIKTGFSDWKRGKQVQYEVISSLLQGIGGPSHNDEQIWATSPFIIDEMAIQ